MSEQGVFLVTGGSRGIGAATAVLAARRGYSVAIFFRERADAAEKVVAEVTAAGARALAVQADVADEASLMQGFAAVDKFGKLAVLVNNAGISGGVSRVEDLTSATIEAVCRVNIVGAFLASREAVRRMSTRRGGSGGAIVNVSSGASVLGTPNTWIHYAATKGAMDTLTIGLSKEVAAEGIRVNAVRPGIITTEIHSVRAPGQLEQMKKAIPMGRFGASEEIADVILWLASAESSYVTGALLDARGGL